MLKFLLAAVVGTASIAVCQARNAALSHHIVNLSESASAEAPGRPDKMPEIMAEGNVVHTFWFKSRPEGGHSICYRRSLNRGETWEPIYEFYQQDSALRDSLVSPVDRHLAVENGRVHIVFGAYGGEGGGWYGQLLYLRSLDNGATFEEPRVLWASGGPGVSESEPWHAYNPRVVANGDRLAICFRRQANWYDHLSARVLTSSNGGESFSDVEAATGGGGGGWSVEDFHVNGDQVSLLYYQASYSFGLTRGDLHLSVSNDGGQSFRQSKISIPSSNGNDKALPSHDQHYSPVLAGAGNSVFAVWHGLDAEDQPSIFFRRSTDGGASYGDATNLTSGTGIIPAQLNSQHTIASEGDRVYVLIHTTASRVYVRKSTDAGATFGPLVEVTDPVGESYAAGSWWPVIKTVPRGPGLPPTLHVVCAGLKTFISTDDAETFTGGTFPVPIWSLREGHRPQMAIDDQGSLHGICEGAWTWYSTGLFGDPDILYSRLDPIPAAGVSDAFALQLETYKNRGDGTGDERYDGVLVPASDTVLPRSAFTVECWVQSNRVNPNAETYFIEKEGPGAGGSWETLLLGQWRSGQADARLATDVNGYVLVDGPVLQPGTWHHLAMTYDSQAAGENFVLYVNGAKAAATRAEGLVKSGRGPLLLGGDTSERTEGTVVLDEVRLWDRALSEVDISSRMNQMLNGSEAGLAAWYPLDKTTRDLSGNGNHGVVLYRESFTAGKLGSPPPPAQEVELFYNGNVFGVMSGPTAPTMVTFTDSTTITRITNYHYFNGGQLPGTIALRHEDGTSYGPWQSAGRDGQGGVPNAYWDVTPNVTIKPGTYTVIDSHPETWSHNTQSGGAGFTWIHGYAATTGGSEQILFSEDFESYATGSDFIGQNGWSGFGPIPSVVSTMTVNTGSYLDSKVLDGRDPAGTGWIMSAAHAIESLSSDGVSTLSFDAYATADPATINSGVGLGKDPSPVGFDFESFVVHWDIGPQADGWTFDARGIGGTRESVAGGIDLPVRVAIVVDGPANEVYGVIEDSEAGRRETQRFAISAETIRELDAVALFVDKSLNRTGPEYDNIEVSVSTGAPQVTFSEWVESHGVPAGQSGPHDDPNGDGVTNLGAFFAGLSPVENGLSSLPTINLSPDGRITMDFPRATNTQGVTGMVEISSNGIDWQKGPDPTVVGRQGSNEMLSAELTSLIGPLTLARLKYELAP